ncbi:pyridine nucleotide-disulfide oxidoreductase [Serratia liquefaciens FK01]|nr:pyridine nucleotide-disulfide oxidoreductase [Serratia liquefaciens FK01]
MAAGAQGGALCRILTIAPIAGAAVSVSENLWFREIRTISAPLPSCCKTVALDKPKL